LLIVFAIYPAYPQKQSEPSQADQQRVLSQGNQIASAVSTVTSTAISPLFGVCVLGIYQYARTPRGERANLPFYSKPTFWTVIGIILILVLLKDSLGGTAPLLKKPLDALGVLVLNKASLVLISFPVMIHEIDRLTGVKLAAILDTVEPITYAADFGTTSSGGHIAAAGLGIAVGTVVTIVMWMLGQVVDVLCLVSPLPFVDLLLKGLRNAVVLALAVTTVLSPHAGLVVSLVLIVLGAVLFFKALRLSIMGSYFAWDLFRLMAFSHRPPSTDTRDTVLGFSTANVGSLPRHTLGHLAQSEAGDLEFRYRIFGFGPYQRQRLNKAELYRIGRGLLYPSIVAPIRSGTLYRAQFRLLPRYKGREEAVRTALGAGEVQDLFLEKGWRKFLTWADIDRGTSLRETH
jgi:hypothetical protein